MFICPVCGYDKLTEEPYDRDGNPSYEVCDCCGFEFGFDDGSAGHTFQDYLQKWIENRAQWFKENAKPENWDLQKQLERIPKKGDQRDGSPN